MKKIKQVFSLILCLAMLLSLAACSCGNKQEDSQDTVNGSDVVYVPEYQYIKEDVSDTLVYGNMLYGSLWSYDEEKEESQYRLARWDLSTLEKEELPYSSAAGSIGQITMTPDGALLLLVVNYSEEGSAWSLVSLDENGNFKSETSITDLITSYMTDPEYGIYPQSMAADKEGNIYLYLSGRDDTLVVLDSEGNKKFDLSGDGWFRDVVSGADGKVYVVSYDFSETGSSMCLKAVDAENKAWGETYSGIPENSGSTYICAEDETHFLISSGDVLYRYDLTTQSAEKILNWLDCDINTNNMRGFAVLEDGRILASSYNWSSDEAVYELTLLSAAKASEVKQKTVLTYGTLYLDYDLREQIIQFNKTNDSYRIEVKEYSSVVSMGDVSVAVGGSMDAGLNAFNADLAAGNAPDLINLSQLNFANYANKGAFVDLNAFLEKDSTISREDLVAKPLGIYELNGNLYGIPLSFSIATLMGRTSVLHGKTGWTVQDVQEIMAEQPEGTEFIAGSSRENLMYMLIAYQLDNYIDWAANTCSFDSEDFINILKFVGSFPSYEDMAYEYGGTYSKIHDGKVLVSDNGISSIGWYLAMLAMYDNNDVTFIGYPTADGSNGSMLVGGNALAISASSKNQEGAWEFLRYLLSEDYQKEQDWDFPILQSALDDMLEEAMSEDVSQNGFGWDDFHYEQVPATQEQIDKLKELIDMAKPKNFSTDSAITEIISEEADAFFSGQKTAEAVADIIQSRVSIYVSENY